MDEHGDGVSRTRTLSPDATESPGFAHTVPVSPAAPDLPAGAVLDRYIIIRRIGAGGMGVVYQAHDPELDRKVALKLVHPGRVTDAASRARLLREAQAMAKLSHPAVVPVFDVGTHDDRMFVAMEFVDGQTLATWLRQSRPDWRPALALLAGAGRGLAVAHAAGVVHRDFKPDNVLVASDGRVAVTDFGLAQLAFGQPVDGPEDVLTDASEPSYSPGRLTESGAVMGTPAYMAPEQHLGGAVDARSDQFAFCVALYEALYGERPFRSEDERGIPSAMVLAAEVTQGRVRPAPPASRVPGWIRKLVLRGLAVEPGDRWPTMDALLDALEAVPHRRRRRLIGAGAIAAALIAGGAVVAALALARPAASPDAACDSVGAEAARLWGAGERAALRAAFARSGRPFAADFAGRVERRFDEWTRRWRTTRVEICRRVGTGELSTAVAEPRVDCLDRRLDQLGPRVALLTAHPSDEVVDRALDLATIPDADECTRIGDGLPAPADPARRAQILDLYRKVDDLDTERTRKRHGLTDEGAQVLAQAERLAWSPLSNYARGVVAKIAYVNGDCKRALDLAARAAESAPAESQVGLAANMWEIRLDCFRELDDTAGIDHALLAARALVRQLSSNVAAIRLQISISAAEQSLGHMSAAEEACRAAAAAAEQPPADDEERAAALNCLADIYSGQGKNAEAITAAEATLAARERALGPNHTDVAVDLQNLAICYQRVGRHREAVEVKRRALAIEERFWGEGSQNVANALQALGWALVYVGETEEAHRDAMRALAIVERTPPQAAGDLILFYLLAARTVRDRDPLEADRLYLRADEVCGRAGRQYDWGCVGAYDLHAEALRQRKQCKRALPLYRKAIDLFNSIEGRAAAAGLTLLGGRGLCLSDLGRHREALADLERALSLLSASTPPEDAAAVKLALGQALAAAGKDRARAADLMREARAQFVQAGAAHEKDVREADRELRKLGRRR